MIKFVFSPYDVLFLGSGKPFNPGIQDITSIFPPFQNTLVSAICSKIYYEKGIDVSKIIKNLYGPFIKYNEKLLFPKPLDILKEKKKEKEYEVTLLKLKQNFQLLNPVDTDLKENLKSLLWHGGNKDFESFEAFIDEEGLNFWLDNREISKNHIIEKKEIFEYESRIGIKMNYELNTVSGEDSLYRVNFVRLKEEIKLVFFVEFNYNNSGLLNADLNNDGKMLELFNKYPRILKFGGESRSISYECEKEDVGTVLNFKKPDVKNGDIIKILFLTPYIIEKNLWEDFNKYSKVISACVIGMNIGMHSKKYGVKLKRALSSGSVIYIKVGNVDELSTNWFSPKTGEFIGCNLMIYGKI